jgi:hypothetical protein
MKLGGDHLALLCLAVVVVVDEGQRKSRRLGEAEGGISGSSGASRRTPSIDVTAGGFLR